MLGIVMAFATFVNFATGKIFWGVICLFCAAAFLLSAFGK